MVRIHHLPPLFLIPINSICVPRFLWSNNGTHERLREIEIRCQRTDSRHRAGAAHWACADDGMDESCVLGENHSNWQDRFLEPFAPEILDERRRERPRSNRQRYRVRLRWRYAADSSGAEWRRLPRGISIVLLSLGSRRWFRIQNHGTATYCSGANVRQE